MGRTPLCRADFWFGDYGYQHPAWGWRRVLRASSSRWRHEHNDHGGEVLLWALKRAKNDRGGQALIERASIAGIAHARAALQGSAARPMGHHARLALDIMERVLPADVLAMVEAIEDDWPGKVETVGDDGPGSVSRWVTGLPQRW